MKKPFRYERRRTSAQAEALVFFDDHHVIEHQLQARHVFEIIRNDYLLTNCSDTSVTGLWFRDYGSPAFLGTGDFSEEQFNLSTVVNVPGQPREVMIYIPWL